MSDRRATYSFTFAHNPNRRGQPAATQGPDKAFAEDEIHPARGSIRGGERRVPRVVRKKANRSN